MIPAFNLGAEPVEVLSTLSPGSLSCVDAPSQKVGNWHDRPVPPTVGEAHSTKAAAIVNVTP